MIASLRGKVLSASPEGSVILDVNGIGFEVLTSSSTAEALMSSGNEEVFLYTYMYIREDAMLLYGFSSGDELALFKKLITVSGIGPKGGLSLLSALGADTLRFAIITGDSKTIAKAPGIGKRTAERLVIDLRDKLGADVTEDTFTQGAGSTASIGDSDANDAAEALAALGYPRTDAVKAVKQAAAAGAVGTEDLLKGALRFLG